MYRRWNTSPSYSKSPTVLSLVAQPILEPEKLCGSITDAREHRCSADCTALFSALNAGYCDNNKIPREKRIAFNYFEFPDLLHSPQNYFFSSMKIDPFFVIKSYWKLRFLKITKHVSLPKFIQITTSNNSSIFSISIENYENHKLIEFIIYY